ncbi:hypothetical protein JWG42_06540 [Desulfoprunum benzoelyticum]|uniref:Uncharacterized protein n=1 Tax=Desulfoprunum benzoelyticum TaxID=1506996 RepID=A0A840UUN6_9BACT|nr:hypothetical protein [Desulfoprunum benzoelyticum]MBB5348546.1 hypothetical protein [Desulfoprunum benzoelyticum]MBM9529808.1 hypothetical protein [Desulfoprunum benzoelyticum]
MSERNPDTNHTDQTSPAPNDSPQTPLWEFVPPSDYVVPVVYVQSAAANAWQSFRQLFRRRDSSEASFRKEQELDVLPQVRLARLVPPLPWDDAAAALDAALQDWVTADASQRGVKFCIGQPFCGHAEIVSLLGAHHQAVQIPPPSVEEILSNDARWFDNWPAPGGFWVLPNLEHCYLRHANGLGLVRRLLSLAASGRFGRGLVGCDSWAWAYVQRILPLPDADAVTLQAFDGPRLHAMLLGMMTSRSNREIHCYDAETGKEILDTSAAEDHFQQEFADLAAYCRGNVAIAANYWRQRLRSRPDEDETSGGEHTRQPAEGNGAGEHVWVAGMPLDPQLPLGTAEEFFLLLHAMMVHGGLPAPLAEDLLPFSATHCYGLLGQLQQSGIAHCFNGRWQVRESSYAAIRRLLRAGDYLTDSF